jgi:hypothetical protein
MKKAIAFILLIIVLGAIGYIYLVNQTDLSVQIERLKLQHAIGHSSSPESIIIFSETLVKEINTENGIDETKLQFESYYWAAQGYNKKMAKYINKEKNRMYSVDCQKDEGMLEAIENYESANTNLNRANESFVLVRDDFKIIEKEDLYNKLEGLEKAIEINSAFLESACPANFR